MLFEKVKLNLEKRGFKVNCFQPGKNLQRLGGALGKTDVYRRGSDSGRRKFRVLIKIKKLKKNRFRRKFS